MLVGANGACSVTFDSVRSDLPEIGEGQAVTGPEPLVRLVVGVWPGRSFTGNEFVSTFANSLAIEGCDVVDVENPLWIERRVDVLHVHWAEQIFWQSGRWGRVSCTLYLLRQLKRLRASGTRIVWMVHNLKPHRCGPAGRVAWWIIAHSLPRLCDGFMTLSPLTIEPVTRAFPALKRKPCAAALHPTYISRSDLPNQRECRDRIGLPHKSVIFGLIGSLSPYKGVEELLREFLKTKRPNSHLLISGPLLSEKFGARIKRLIEKNERIHLETGSLSNEQFAVRLRAIDAAVLPYRRYLHSGTLIHAISYGCPVITPSTPYADDVSGAVGEGWITRYRGPLKASVLEHWQPPLHGEKPDLTALQPEVLGRSAIALYNQLTTDHVGRSASGGA